MSRSANPLLWLFLLLTILGSAAWFTRHPDTEILRLAERWPGVGPLVLRFRAAYLPRQRSVVPITTAEEQRDVEEVVVSPPTDDIGARPQIWIEAGTPIHEEPDSSSAILETASSLMNLSLLEQRGDWSRIRRPRAGRQPVLGWVRLEHAIDPSPTQLQQPEPVLPLPAAPPDGERVAAARALMKGGGVEASCGPQPLYTDFAEGELVAICPRLAEALESAYGKRYGLEPVSPPAEAIVIFRNAHDYRAFRDLEGISFDSNQAHTIPARGYLALHIGERSRPEVLATLAHELVHLLNRRALGPALPAWLSEGLADDLAESRIDEDGTLHPGTLGGERVTNGLQVISRGGLASAVGLLEALDGGRLPPVREIVQLDEAVFYRPDRARLHYAASSFWVRYLLSGFSQELPRGFRAFLADVASGAAITDELLLTRLGQDWGALESGFRTWLRLQYLPPPGEWGTEPTGRTGSDQEG